MDMDQEINDLRRDITNLTVTVGTACESYATKASLEHHVGILNAKVENILWKGISGFVATGAAFVILFSMVDNTMDDMQKAELANQALLIKEIGKLNVSSETHTTKLEFIKEDVTELKLDVRTLRGLDSEDTKNKGK